MKIAIIGGGNMGEAILAALLNKKLAMPPDITVSESISRLHGRLLSGIWSEKIRLSFISITPNRKTISRSNRRNSTSTYRNANSKNSSLFTKKAVSLSGS